MKHVSFCILAAYILLHSSFAHAQKNGKEPGMYWGINVEMYFGNRHDAFYYNGDNSRPVSLEDVVFQQQTHYDIMEYLDDGFTIQQIPYRFIYNPGVGVGLNLQYYTSPKLSFYSNINILLLESYGVFVLELDSPTTNPDSYSNTEQGTITASEKRLNINGGAHILIPIDKSYIPYLELGFTASILQTDSHMMQIGPISRNMYFSSINYVNEGAIYSAFGYGPQIGAGAQFPLGDYYVFAGGKIDFLKFNLIETGFNANYSIIARIMF
ncbi:MAG: hypothetical protein PF481_00415 [Bacteroidales bacterium]|jgi:hypothetical protein|nr:hypothetical protein [Bacteroidales bacterium]